MELSLFILTCISLLVSSEIVKYPQPSIYPKSGNYILTVNNTQIYPVAYSGYDYVQLSMSQGYATKFTVTALKESTVGVQFFGAS
jgi:hypothetical protein